MSHDQVIKQMKENLAQLGSEVREGTQHQARSIFLSAAAGAVFALATSWIAFKLFS
ncbi:hypothetical protein [Pseudomonas putida]|uniref:hypothetical protein n=1 Tax=Pseudomonas putida group TaxID=136845 RepID=UPI000422243B|nr:hypothetical protein [Pseudomonas putida]